MAFDWSGNEKLAVAKVLLDIVNTDGIVTRGEASYFEQLQLTLGISNAEIESAKGFGVERSIEILRNLSMEKKSALRVMMLEMVQADGEVDRREMEIFVVVCMATGIPLPELNN